MRKLIAAGNWKMNLSATEAQALASAITKWVASEYTGSAEVIFGVPTAYLSLIHEIVKDQPNVQLSAQNIHQAEKGAYTGENSVSMVADVGARVCLVGHSERRQYFGEDNALLAQKIDRVLAAGLTPIYCVGEKLEQREAGQALAINQQQISEGVFHLSADDFSKLILAYEPVWAIGTGVTASPEQAQEVHQYIRSLVANKYGQGIAEHTSILYGGSVKAANAATLFAQPDIDGGLVGGASLKADDFIEIIKAL